MVVVQYWLIKIFMVVEGGVESVLIISHAASRICII
jgi:hypothetical protein